jgi:ornithine cyclodeaminase
MKLRIISRDDINKVLTMKEVIQAVKKAYIALSAGQAIMPTRLQIPVEKAKGVTLFMPAYLRSENALGTKIVSVFPQNIKKYNCPTIQAVFLLLSAETGQPLALMEAASLTALRTGAASGVATELLARPEAKMAAIFGAGVQGRTQLRAISEVRSLEKVLVYDPDETAASRFCEEMRRSGPPVPARIDIAASPQEAVAEADIICTATTATRPVFPAESLPPGTHINAIGSFTPWMQEIPEEVVSRAKIVVDSREACLEEAGDLIIPLKKGLISPQDIYAEIGDIARGQLPGREDEQEITLFKSVGLAVQDVVAAQLLLEKARQQSIGQEVEL